MVQLKSSLYFLFATITVASAAVVGKRDAATVKADIATLTTSVTKLDNDINAFPNSGGTVAGALGIHTDATTVISNLQKGTTDAKATSTLSEADGQEILASLNSLKPTILDSLTVIVQKKPAFDALPLGGISTIVLQDLQSLNTNTASFADALIAISPADLQDDGAAFKSEVASAFATAIDAYDG